MPRRFWSEADKARLGELYPGAATAEVAKALGRPLAGTYGMAKKLGLGKTAEYLAAHCRLQKGSNIGHATAFKKGHAPANKGVRRPGWAPGRIRETQFKPGERTGVAAQNWKPIGTILPDGEGFYRIKVREAVFGKEPTGFGNTGAWPLLNRIVWEAHHGRPIPPKHIVKFKDGDRSNCDPDNLELISMADNCRRNSLWSVMPRELAEVIQLNGALKRKIRRLNGKE